MLSNDTVEICKILLPLIILITLLWIICNNKFENFQLPWDAKSQVPRINELTYKQLNPLEKARELPNDDSNLPPNFNLNSSQVTNMKKDSIYRQKTGRQAYEIEYFVNRYDSNFGGQLGTQMGLTP